MLANTTPHDIVIPIFFPSGSIPAKNGAHCKKNEGAALQQPTSTKSATTAVPRYQAQKQYRYREYPDSNNKLLNGNNCGRYIAGVGVQLIPR